MTHCHYCHNAESTHCIFYDVRAMAYRAEDVRDAPPGLYAHVPYACGPCAEVRRDELDARDKPAVRLIAVEEPCAPEST